MNDFICVFFFLFFCLLSNQVITGKIVDCDFDGLRDLVTDDLLEQIKKAVEHLPIEQRQELFVRKDDIVSQFIRHLEITESDGRIFIEVFLIGRVFRNFSEIKEMNIDSDKSVYV